MSTFADVMSSDSDASKSSSSSFSLADDVQEDSATAALLMRGCSSAQPQSSGGLAAVLQNNSELRGSSRHHCADRDEVTSSQNATSPLQPLDSVFQSTASLPRGGGDGLEGTIRRIIATQLEDNSPKHLGGSHSQRSVSSSVVVGLRASSGLEDDMMHTLSDAANSGPANFDATAIGESAPLRGGPTSEGTATAHDVYNDTFEDDDEDDLDEAAVERELAMKKYEISLQAERDAIDEEEFTCRRDVEDAQRQEGWLGSAVGGLSILFTWFHEQTEVMEDEMNMRNDVTMQQSSNWDAIRGVVENELRSIVAACLETSLRDCIARELTDRESVEVCEKGAHTALAGTLAFLLAQTTIAEAEGVARQIVEDEHNGRFEKCIALESSESCQALARQEWREQNAAVLCAEEAESRVQVTSMASMGADIIIQSCLACLNVFCEEQLALSQLQQQTLIDRFNAENQETLRIVKIKMESTLRDEAAARKELATDEWNHRRPMYDAHRKSLVTIRPRKPAVPRVSKKIHIPVPPEKPPAAQNLWSNKHGTEPSCVGRPKLHKMAPLPLRRLPPYADFNAPAPTPSITGRISSTAVDEGVGRKSLVAREHHEWTSLISNFRHVRRDIDHTEATAEEEELHRAYQHGQGPFRVSQHEYGRFRDLKEDAKRRRAHNEERFRLQALVARLIAVDVKFEAKLAAKLSKSRATAVHKPRPPFHCGSVGTADAHHVSAWEIIPRMGIVASERRSTGNDGSSPQRGATESPQREKVAAAVRQRPATAAAGHGPGLNARPPQAPRPVHSARPVSKSAQQSLQEKQPDEAFVTSLERKLDEALIEGDQPRSSALDSPDAKSSRASSPSTASSPSSQSSRSSPRRSGSSSSDDDPGSEHRSASDGRPVSDLQNTTRMESAYGDDSFYSEPASPEKRCQEEQPLEGESSPSRCVLPLKEEVVHSLIHHGGSGSSVHIERTSPSSPPAPSNAAAPQDGDQESSSRSVSSNGSWHPMVFAESSNQ